MKRILPALFVLFFATPLFATTWTITNSDTTFTPPIITIAFGDTVLFSLASPHNAQEVDSLTWANNSNSPVIGFNTPVGGGTVTGLSVGTHYYVCSTHASSGMKGQIIVHAVNPTGDCADLFFSEYIMAATPGRAIEIYNPTSQPVNLSDYRILQSTDGGVSTDVFGLSGMLAPNDVYVIAHPGSDSVIIAKADTLTTFLTYDGNDALALLHFTDTIDIIGQLWVNPGLAWGVDAGSTWYNTIIRKYYTFHGGTDWNTTAQTWFGFPSFSDSLGFHHMAVCGSSPPIATIHFISSGAAVSESAGVVPVIVEVNNPTTSPVSFVVGHNNGASTATIQADYNFNVPTYTNYPGTSYDTLWVTIIDDQILEPTETAVIYLTNLTGNGKFIVDSVFNLNIIDNDTLTVSFNGAGFSYVEDANLVQIKLTINGKVPDTTSVFVSLAPGNATRGVDFTFNDTTIVFPPNSMDTQSVWVRIIDDTIVEPNEQINFDLSNVTNGAQLAITAYTLTIIDNDSPNGIAEIDLSNNIKVYPNPVTNTLFVQTENDLKNVTVTDLVGNTILDIGKFSTGKNTIDVSSLSTGMYFINVHYEQKSFSTLFVKQD